MPVRIEAILECQNYLGEGPVRDVEEARLTWVDGTYSLVNRPAIWRMAS